MEHIQNLLLFIIFSFMGGIVLTVIICCCGLFISGRTVRHREILEELQREEDGSNKPMLTQCIPRKDTCTVSL